MSGRIIFVGVHNKPGMEPLDSRTKSGKIIDEVIKGLTGRECIKTNLLGIDMPNEIYFQKRVKEWVSAVRPQENDVFVIFGKTVKKYFPLWKPHIVIEAEHPASRRIKKDEYVKDLIQKILNT